MPFGRIQTLLCDEYCQFVDTVLIESPFAETTRDGRGLEQVHLGITPTKLIIAGDYIETMAAAAWRGLDPSVETLELLSLYPVELVELSVFGAPARQTLRARLANRVTRYFELGGLEKRRMFWNLWCERVLDLNPDAALRTPSPRTPHATSAALQTWDSYCYRPSYQRQSKRRRWTDRDLYLGSKHDGQNIQNPTPVPGIGITAELKLLYVKPKQTHLPKSSDRASKHCFRLQESTCGFEVLTYTGEPTSNVTYTSLSKAHSGAGYSTFRH